MSFLSPFKYVAAKVQRNPVLCITAGVVAYEVYTKGPLTPDTAITLLVGLVTRSTVVPAPEAEAKIADLQTQVVALEHSIELAGAKVPTQLAEVDRLLSVAEGAVVQDATTAPVAAPTARAAGMAASVAPSPATAPEAVPAPIAAWKPTEGASPAT